MAGAISAPQSWLVLQHREEKPFSFEKKKSASKNRKGLDMVYPSLLQGWGM